MSYAQHTSWQLARLAECADPDAHDGIGFEHLPTLEYAEQDDDEEEDDSDA